MLLMPAQEAEMVLLTVDDTSNMEIVNKECVAKSPELLLGGFCHLLTFGATKAKRISHSISHAETNAAVRVQHSAQLAAIRISEIRLGLVPRGV